MKTSFALVAGTLFDNALIIIITPTVFFAGDTEDSGEMVEKVVRSLPETSSQIRWSSKKARYE